MLTIKYNSTTEAINNVTEKSLASSLSSLVSIMKWFINSYCYPTQNNIPFVLPPICKRINASNELNPKRVSPAIIIPISILFIVCLIAQILISSYYSHIVFSPYGEAKATNAETLYDRGYSYEYGQDSEQNYSKAYDSYLQAAKNYDYAPAQYSIGTFYDNGYYVEQDYEMAATWYQKAVKQGYSVAQSALATLYLYGNGMPEDYEAAFELFHLAAEYNNTDAQYYLGYMYYHGYHVDKDIGSSMEWFNLAAMNGNSESMEWLGWMYYEGVDDIGINYEEAFKWFTMGADYNNSDCQVYLGLIYEDGLYVEKDEKQAFIMYQKAADHGNDYGQYNTGYCYYSGIGVDIDYNLASIWYQKAADQDMEDAQYWADESLIMAEGQ